ncbi:expressed hypothetical protein [Trichoplax adhaerens]|uniref:CS domain-containing protein n=1 Tax=Trichoplax adhaerens TaxID=10228 RepID=B3RT98_TRIAD|nr:expressed hypothetical protein [Trichoplax adhaerens]EDV27190.1 expressed hypothetical protein [Trichoplax adhaerens]|eukprot:XP_002111186.1 expressed hypothetical protein [Trichoplax adhaerens]
MTCGEVLDSRVFAEVIGRCRRMGAVALASIPYKTLIDIGWKTEKNHDAQTDDYTDKIVTLHIDLRTLTISTLQNHHGCLERNLPSFSFPYQFCTWLTPPVLWAQRQDVLFLTIALTDIREPKIDLDTNKLSIECKAGTNGATYRLECEFYNEIEPKESKQNLTSRQLVLNIKKKESGPYWPRVLKQAQKPGWLKVDFNRWRDEDESEEESNDKPDFSQMMQNMGGGGGMPPGFGEGDLGDLPDSDDDNDDSDDEKMPDLES